MFQSSNCDMSIIMRPEVPAPVTSDTTQHTKLPKSSQNNFKLTNKSFYDSLSLDIETCNMYLPVFFSLYKCNLLGLFVRVESLLANPLQEVKLEFFCTSKKLRPHFVFNVVRWQGPGVQKAKDFLKSG